MSACATARREAWQARICARDVDSREDASPRRADSQFSLQQEEISGDHSGGETPVPIPNTAVQPTSADGTALATGGESRSLPGSSFCMFGARIGDAHDRPLLESHARATLTRIVKERTPKCGRTS